MRKEDENIPTGTVAAGAVANVAERLHGIEFPAGRWEVLQRAVENGADESVLETIRRLPAERRYDDPMQLFDAIGDEIRKVEAKVPPGTREPLEERKGAVKGGFRALLDKWQGRS